MSASTMFSYAQAAKGLAPSTQTNSTTASSASSDHGRDVSSATESVIQQQSRSRLTSSQPEHGSDQKEAHTQVVPEIELPTGLNDEEPKKPLTKTSESGQNTTTGASSTNSDTASSSHDTYVEKRDEAVAAVGTGTNPLVNGEKAAEAEDKDKKETDDDWEKVSVPSVAAEKEKELKAAPIPSVNFWQQRKEQQAAKSKDVSTQRPSGSAVATATTPPTQPPPKQRAVASNDEIKRRSVAKDGNTEKEQQAPQRRVNSGSRVVSNDRKDSSTQVAPRSLSQQPGKAASTVPPPVANAEMWPTPDSAPNDERRKSGVFEKNDKPDAKSNNQKKWVAIPFVPTAKFETQLPAGAARRGGRPSNRGRDNGNKGAHHVQASHATEKPEVGTMGPPPIPNKVGEQDRGRRSDTPRNPRASSVPSENHEAAADGENVSNFRKFSGTPTKEQYELNKSFIAAPQKNAPATESSNTGVPPSRSSSQSSQQQNVSQQSNRGSDAELKDTAHAVSTAPSVFTENVSRSVSQSDRFRESPIDNVRGAFSDRIPQNREWSRGRPDTAREKSESWRERREPRAERGRGTYRGRGNHNGYNSHSHSYGSPQIQNGFDPSRSVSGPDVRNRQTSQPFVQSQTQGNVRVNSRSQSIPLAMAQGGYFPPSQGFPQALSPVQTDFNYASQMPSGIMSAMPYSDQLSSYALISMVVTQLEYYFSIDNLCKDLFLRKNMDSQGFVSLSVISNFKRIKALTDGQMSHEQFRSVCQQARNIEFITGEDGEDRLRSRENWRDFVLPLEERLPSARHEGPRVRAHQQHASSATPFDFPAANGPMRSPQQMNGFAEPFVQPMPVQFSPIVPFDGQNTEQFSPRIEPQPGDQARPVSATSPFSNAQSPHGQELSRTPSNYMANGHHPSISAAAVSEDVFPNEKIPELKVVVRDPAYEGEPPAPAEESSVSGLRGGAASPERLEQFRNNSFGQAMASPAASQDNEHPPYWTKEGEIAKVPVGPGYVHEDYLALHEKAILQRIDEHFDGALAVLYTFWSTFLVNNFNLSMYHEFSKIAKDDVQLGNDNGKKHLLQYYDVLLSGKKPMSERIANDIINMARQETGDRRPTYQKLRSTWRNGATNLKTRKRLGDMLTAEEKAEFDKTG